MVKLKTITIIHQSTRRYTRTKEMPKLDGKLMHESLQALCVPGEKYYHAVYGKVRKSGGSTSPINNIYGFVAITDMQRLLVAGFTMFGEPMGKMCVPLHMIKSMKVNKTIFGQKSVKIEIDNQGEDIKLDCTFAENVYAMGLPNQKENLDELIKIIDNRDALLKAAESCQKLSLDSQAAKHAVYRSSTAGKDG